ncbi:MAG: hypothetical protein Q6K80_01125 [Thermostichus sp. DG_1_6_bins_120]
MSGLLFSVNSERQFRLVDGHVLPGMEAGWQEADGVILLAMQKEDFLFRKASVGSPKGKCSLSVA